MAASTSEVIVVSKEGGQSGMIGRNTITNRLARGVGVNLLGQVITTGQNLILVPLFLTSWGVALYGDWLALSAAAAYMALLDIGMQNYAVNLMNIHRTREEHDQFHQVLHSALSLYMVIVGITFVFIVSLVWWVPWVELLGLQMIGQTMSGAVLVLSGVQILAAIPIGLLSGIYRCVGEYDRGQSIGNVLRLFSVGITCSALLTGGSPPVVAALLAFQPFLALSIIKYDLRRRHSGIHIGVSRSSWRLSASFFMPSIFFFLFPLSNSLTSQGVSLVLAATLGSTSLVAFSTTRTLANLVRQVFSASNSALWPEMTSLFAAGQFDRLRVLNAAACKYSLGAALAVASFLYFFADHIFTLWTGNRVEADRVLLGIFLISAVSNSLWYTSGMIQVAANLHRNAAIRTFLTALTTIVLAMILIQFWRERGVALAVLFADLLFSSFSLMRNTCRIIKESAIRLLVELIARCAPFACCVFLVSWTLSRVAGHSWHEFAATGMLYSLLAAVIAWICLMGRPEKELIRTWLVRTASTVYAEGDNRLTVLLTKRLTADAIKERDEPDSFSRGDGEVGSAPLAGGGSEADFKARKKGVQNHRA
ncbi:MAG: lipopolysaccharide biosynthesis protein [candidate division NC10 bacterium]|nr:lipopolysaccharide biosynthesis protein [candidate division NC10 bacterium]